MRCTFFQKIMLLFGFFLFLLLGVPFISAYPEQLLLEQGWYSSGDTFFLGGAMASVTINTDGTKVSLHIADTGTIVDNATCTSLQSYYVCVNETQTNPLRAFIQLYDHQPYVTVNRSVSTLSLFPQNTTSFTLTFTNKGTSSGQFTYTEHYPSAVTVQTSGPCSVQDHNVQLSASLTKGASIECTVTVKALSAVNYAVTGQLQPLHYLGGVDGLILAVQHPVSFEAWTNHSSISVIQGKNSTKFFVNMTNTLSSAVPVTFLADIVSLEGAVSIQPSSSLSVTDDAVTWSGTINPYSSVLLQATIASSQPGNISLLPQLWYSIEGQELLQQLPVLDVSFFANYTLSDFCTFSFSELDAPLNVSMVQHEGPVLPSQSHHVNMTVRNEANDKDITDIRLELLVNEELVDVIKIPYLPSCQAVRLLPYVFAEHVGGQQEFVLRFLGSGYADGNQLPIDTSVTITQQQADISASTSLPSSIVRNTWVERTVSLESEFVQPVQVLLYDVLISEHDDDYDTPDVDEDELLSFSNALFSFEHVAVRGVTAKQISLSGSQSQVLSYELRVPSSYEHDNLAIQTMVVFLDDDGQTISILTEDTAAITSSQHDIALTVADDDFVRGSLLSVPFVFENSEQKTLHDVVITFPIGAVADTRQRQISLGSIPEDTSIDFSADVRFITNETTVDWGNFTVTYVVDDVLHAQELALADIALSGQPRRHGLSFLEQVTYDHDNRIFDVVVNITNHDTVPRTVFLPFVDVFSINYDDTDLSIEPGDTFSLSYTALSFDRFAWQDISYRFQQVQMHSGTVLSSFTIPDVPDVFEEQSEMSQEDSETLSQPEQSQQPAPQPITESAQDDSVLVVGEQSSFFSPTVLLLSLCVGILCGVVFFVVRRKKNS